LSSQDSFFILQYWGLELSRDLELHKILSLRLPKHYEPPWDGTRPGFASNCLRPMTNHYQVVKSLLSPGK
jgi:hypothetical protein